MKLKFLSLAILLSILFFAMPSLAVFYGICCPSDCPEGQEAKEVSTDKCECTCTSGKTVPTTDGSNICCEGSNNISTGKTDQTCCEDAGGKYVGNGGQGFPEACCVEGSSKDTNGDLNPTCCKEAGGAIRNGKCCRQSPQGS